jgi:glycosyltransferase involved in cell wall biosynthesis
MRPDRAFMIAEVLAANGHEVTWWASAFDHVNKKFRSKDLIDIKVSPGFSIRLVPTTGYTKNISYKRILHERNYSNNIYSQANKYPDPDIILLSEPALFRSRPIIKLIEEYKCLLVLDVLDTWPELFNIILPKKLQFLGDFIFKPWYKSREKLFQRADSIVAVSNSYMELAKKIKPDIPTELTEIIYFGTNVELQRKQMKNSDALPASLDGLNKKKDELWAIYTSSLGSNYDVDTLLKTAKLLEIRNSNIKLLIAGEGPLRKKIEDFIDKNNLTQTIYIGNPDSKVIAKVFSLCDVGLSMYVRDSSVTFPIKAFHYFAAGLPIVNSLGGDLSKMLSSNNAGIQYLAEDCESLFGALTYLSSHPSKREEMAKNSFNLAMNFDQDTQYKKFAKFVENAFERISLYRSK